jgi:hypothetical protein
MRTERAISQMGQVTAFSQVSDLRTVTITASDRAWPRLAAPILLPKSDTGGCQKPDRPICVDDLGEGSHQEQLPDEHLKQRAALAQTAIRSEVPYPVV